MGYVLNADEVAVVVKPNIKDGEYVGITTGMVLGKDVHELSSMGEALIDIALTMAAAVIAGEGNPELLDYLEDFKVDLVKDMFPEQYAEVLSEMDAEAEANTLVKDGNVLSLNKWTETKGRA